MRTRTMVVGLAVGLLGVLGVLGGAGVAQDAANSPTGTRRTLRHRSQRSTRTSRLRLIQAWNFAARRSADDLATGTNDRFLACASAY